MTDGAPLTCERMKINHLKFEQYMVKALRLPLDCHYMLLTYYVSDGGCDPVCEVQLATQLQELIRKCLYLFLHGVHFSGCRMC